MPFPDLMTREGGAAELPQDMADEIIGDVSRRSTVLQLGHIIRTNTRDSRIPVLSSLPDAYCITGDAGLKQTGSFAFTHQAVVAEELAVIVPIPDNVIADSGVPPLTWDRTMAEALVADWSNVIVGIREDIKLEIFNSGVISDDTGKVVLNLLQQDTSAMRATFRVGYLLAKPANDYGSAGSPSPSSARPARRADDGQH